MTTGNSVNTPDIVKMAYSSTASTQDTRRREMLDVAMSFAQRCYGSDGQWKVADPSDSRERVWLALGLLQGNPPEQEMANRILSTVPFVDEMSRRTPREAETLFEIFVSNHCVQALAQFPDRLSDQARKTIEPWALAALGNYPGDRQPDYQFHGYNDNMPAKATLGLILGGEYFNDPAAIEHGLWNLHQLRDLLTRRGVLSEYNSPTYTILPIINLGLVAEYSRNKEARRLALQCVERVWADLLGHFHGPTGLPSGPYSRSYLVDSIGHATSANFVFWLTFGNRSCLNPVKELQCATPRIFFHHEANPSYSISKFAWLSTYKYQPPTYLVDWLDQRRYPFRFTATTERGEGGNTWGANEVLCTNYQERDFAMGASEGEGFNDEPFFVQYRRDDVAATVENNRTVFAKYLIDDDMPGKIIKHELFSGEKDSLPNRGRSHLIQHDQTLLMSVRPRLDLAGKPVKAMRLSVILPEHFGPVQQVEYSDNHVYIRDGLCHIALRPVGGTNWGRKDAVRIETVNRYRVISFFNYEGKPRAFSTQELIQTLNGVVVIVGSASEESFDVFRKRISAGALLDYYFADNYTARYRLGNFHLDMSYGLNSDRIRFTSINGSVVARPVWRADGLPADQLPFLSEPPRPNDMKFPYQNLNVNVNLPTQWPWQIFSRW